MLNLWKEIALKEKYNIYFLASLDTSYNLEKVEVNPANPTCNCYSVAKAFTVTAIGLLYDQGLITPNTLLKDVLGKYYPDDIDDKWNLVSIHNVLLHKIGFEDGILDIDCEDASMYSTTDYLSIVLNTKLKYEPGTTYQYSDAAYYLLSRVVAELAHQDLCDFLRPILMEKLKFKELAWSRCPYGYSIGATGLYIRTEDMVKLGVLYLNEGLWKNERIISKEWVDLVIKNEYEFSSYDNGWYGKGGMRGQFLIFNYDLGKAFACHSYDGKVRCNTFIKK